MLDARAAPPAHSPPSPDEPISEDPQPATLGEEAAGAAVGQLSAGDD